MTQQQKFHTDDQISVYLINHGVPNVNIFDFMFPLVDYGKFCDLLQMSDSKTPMIFLKKNIF